MKPISLADIFIGRARMFNHYQPGESNFLTHSCISCIRRQFSFPETCNDGWPMGNAEWKDQGPSCINWIDKVINTLAEKGEGK